MRWLVLRGAQWGWARDPDRVPLFVEVASQCLRDGMEFLQSVAKEAKCQKDLLDIV